MLEKTDYINNGYIRFNKDLSISFYNEKTKVLLNSEDFFNENGLINSILFENIPTIYEKLTSCSDFNEEINFSFSYKNTFFKAILTPTLFDISFVFNVFSHLEKSKLLNISISKLNDLIVITDSSCNIFYANQTFLSTFGVSESNITNKNFSFFYGEMTNKSTISRINYNMSLKDSFREELICYYGANPLWLELNITPYEENNVIKYWIFVCKDITERKIYEETLKLKQDNMEFILEAGKLAYWEMNLVTNQTLRTLTHDIVYGYSHIQEEWNLDNFINHIYQEDKQRIVQLLDNFTKSNGFNEEFRITTISGEIKWVWCSIKFKRQNNKLVKLIGLTTDITDSKKSKIKIEKLAYFDSLTHLPNRTSLTDKLKSSIIYNKEYKKSAAILYIDLDNFKTINDTKGHDYGDLLLIDAAKRIGKCLPTNCYLARVGGDEFMAVIENLETEDTDAITTITNLILNELSTPFEIYNYKHLCSASIGVKIYSYYDNDTVDDLFKKVDIAMYEAKAAGKNKMTLFKHNMLSKMTNRVLIENQLRKSLSSDNFIVYLQPQISAYNTLLGAEALVRWQPDEIIYPPSYFMGIAEEVGLIYDIDLLVFSKVCNLLTEWEKFSYLNSLKIAINISLTTFSRFDFVDNILKIISNTKVNPHQLKLEITESVFAENFQETISKMNLLKSIGITFSLDDFGTGYSSLTYLKNLPIDQLKIDKSFVNDMVTKHNDKVIAKTIINLAKGLNLNIIAEGVESEDQIIFLKDNGCHDFQGFFYSKPLNVRDFIYFAEQINS